MLVFVEKPKKNSLKWRHGHKIYVASMNNYNEQANTLNNTRINNIKKKI